LSDRVLLLEPVVGWPREVHPGGRYELTADLRAPAGAGSWPFDEEEFEFTCMLDAQPLFTTRILGEPILVLHRFGGTYGPVRYELTAAEPVEGLTGDDYLESGDHGAVSIWLSFANRWGVPVRTVELPVRCSRLPQPSPAGIRPASSEDRSDPAARPEQPAESPPEPSESAAWVPDRSRALDHMVVIMFGGRSFDNVLGRLYQPGEVRAFEGVLGRDLSNPVPEWAPEGGRNMPYGVAPGLVYLGAPPGDEFPHVNTQLFGLIDPPSNRGVPVDQMTAPYNQPANSRRQPSMDGFVADYIASFTAQRGRAPSYSEYAQVMTGYEPRQLPVISALAREFATFDHWFCEVPGPAFSNLSFFHSGTSSGFVENAAPPDSFTLHNTAETIFERLEHQGLSWRVYCDPPAIVSLVGLIHAPRLWKSFATHFFTTDRFLADAAAGDLPAYSFIEPSFLWGTNDMRPESDQQGFDSSLDPPSSVAGGEALLAKIYNAVRSSASPAGSNAYNTLLLVTFDGHGGNYDHVVPPMVPAPDRGAPPGQMGFGFDRSGLRVPAVAISAWIPSRAVVSAECRGTSVIATLREHWQIGPPLTNRDAAARSLSGILTREEPRDPDDWPDVVPRPVPPFLPSRPGAIRGVPRAAFFATLELSSARGASAPSIRQDEDISQADALAVASDVASFLFPNLRDGSPAARPPGGVTPGAPAEEGPLA
jgi:phospholipase C